MFSRSFSSVGRILGGALVLAALAGCSLRFGEAQKSESEIEFAMGETECLGDGGRTFVAIVEGKATEAEVASLWDCAARSLQTFRTRTKGSAPGLYRSQELRAFLERYFLKDTRVSDKLLLGFMQLKRTLLGGTVDAVTDDELQGAIQILGTLRDQNLKLRPFFPLSAEHFAEVDAGTLQAAVTAIEVAAVEISKVLRRTGFDYRFSDLDGLLEELEKASSAPKVVGGMHTIRGYLPAFQQLKALLVSPDPDRIASQEWEPLLTTMNRWYALYLRFSYARHQDPSWVHGAGRTGLVDVAKDFITAIEKAIARRPGRVLPLKEMDGLVDSLDPAIFSFNGGALKPEHLKAFLRTIVKRLLGGNRPGADGRDAIGITQPGLSHAWNLVEDWSEGQRFLDLLYEKWGDSLRVSETDGSLTNLLRSQILYYSIEDVLGVAKSEIRQVTWEAGNRLRDLIGRQRPLFYGDDSEISFEESGADPLFSYNDLTQLNFMNVLARMLAQSYAEDPARHHVGVTLPELKTFYLDIIDIGADLRLFDPSNPLVYAARFLEASLFLPNSDGDGVMNLSETQQILAFMLSSKSLASRTHSRITAVCNPDRSRIVADFFGADTIDPACYRREFFDSVEQAWTHFPLLRNYYRGLGGQAKADFERNFEEAARLGGYSEKPFEIADSEALAGLAHYIEQAYLRWDTDRSGAISLHETIYGGDPLLPVFHNILEQASCKAGTCLRDEYSIEVLCTYMLANGTVPGKFEFVLWYISRPFWHYKADRGRMIEIMAELSRATRGAS